MKANAIFHQYLWPAMMLPAIAFYTMWGSDRLYAYWFITDPDEHEAAFRAQVLPENNYTNLIAKGFRDVAIDIGTIPHRRINLAVHCTVGLVTGFCMMLNLTGSVRTRWYKLHRALGYIAWAGTFFTCAQITFINLFMDYMKVGEITHVTVWTANINMAVALAVGYHAAKAKDWMRHRAAMMYMSANMLYIPLQRFLWTVASKLEYPHVFTTWEEYRDVLMAGTSVVSLIIVNSVATYFAAFTTPPDKRLQAKPAAKAA